jgi:hypothetical protein
MEIGVVYCQTLGCFNEEPHFMRLPPAAPQDTKLCRGPCGLEQPVDNFYRRPHDGIHRSHCKKCHNRKRAKSNAKR